MAMHRREPTVGAFFAAVTWTFVWSILILAGLTIGYFSHIVFFEIFRVQIAFFGVGVFTKLGVDITRALLNRRRMLRRRERAIRNLQSGKWKKRVVGVQKVGRREAALSLYWGLITDKNYTFPYEKYLYVSDSNNVNNPRVRGGVGGAIGAKLQQAFKDAPDYVPKPKQVTPITVTARLLGALWWLPAKLLAAIGWLLVRLGRGVMWILGIRPAPVEDRIYNPIPGPLPFDLPQPLPEDDSYQAEVFLQAFGPENAEVIWVDFVLSEGFSSIEEARKINSLHRRIRDSKARYIMVLQPGRGKREAMFTAAQLHIKLGMEWIMFTDSDTVVEETALQELVYCTYTTVGERPVGAVTGDVRIFNVENWLSFMSSLRYWFAFNLERASQSFGGYVTCVSGPLGLYRAKDLAQVLVPWLNQRFMGKATTFGDDRSLTNYILRLGRAVIYTHLARCWTDTPTKVRIWVRQQTRWNKSYYREFLINIFSLWRFGPYLTFELFFQVLFPIFLAMSLGNLISAAIRSGDWSYAVVWLLSIMLGGFMRAFYAIAMEWNQKPDPQGWGKWKYLWFFGYGFLYVIFLMGARLYALATLPETAWGTPDRVDKKYGGQSSLAP